jgi:hypothetical protein
MIAEALSKLLQRVTGKPPEVSISFDAPIGEREKTILPSSENSVERFLLSRSSFEIAPFQDDCEDSLSEIAGEMYPTVYGGDVVRGTVVIRQPYSAFYSGALNIGSVLIELRGSIDYRKTPDGRLRKTSEPKTLLELFSVRKQLHTAQSIDCLSKDSEVGVPVLQLPFELLPDSGVELKFPSYRGTSISVSYKLTVSVYDDSTTDISSKPIALESIELWHPIVRPIADFNPSLVIPESIACSDIVDGPICPGNQSISGSTSYRDAGTVSKSSEEVTNSKADTTSSENSIPHISHHREASSMSSSVESAVEEHSTLDESEISDSAIRTICPAKDVIDPEKSVNEVKTDSVTSPITRAEDISDQVGSDLCEISNGDLIAEVGITDALHIRMTCGNGEISMWDPDAKIEGTLEYVLVRVPIVEASIVFVKKEFLVEVDSNPGACFKEELISEEILHQRQICQGPMYKGDSIAWHLDVAAILSDSASGPGAGRGSSVILFDPSSANFRSCLYPPTSVAVSGIFSIRYFVGVTLLDSAGRRYYKHTEITINHGEGR